MKKLALATVIFAVMGFISLGFTLINKNKTTEKAEVSISKVENKNAPVENVKSDNLQSIGKSNKELASYD